jgi:hypothetical protein
VPAHDLAERRLIGRPARRCGDDLGDVAEVRRAEDARRDDGEEPRVLVAVIREAVDDAAPDARAVARAELDRLARDRVGRAPGQAVDGLLEGIVAVRQRHLRVGRHAALEDAHAAAGVLGFDEKAHTERAHRNGVPIRRSHGAQRYRSRI